MKVGPILDDLIQAIYLKFDEDGILEDEYVTNIFF